MSPGLERVRQAAKQRKKEKFTALLHHVTVDLLREAYYALKRKAAAGVDGVRWSDYEADLEDNLQDLHARVQGGAYRALPVRRRYIPKPGGKQRPLGIAALEDKIVQRAVVAVLNGIYEEDFLGFSYGFRPKRNQHQGLDALAVGICKTSVNWILDADIRSFFDSVSQDWLVRFLEHRIGDERIIRLVRKWLKAGVLEDGEWSMSEEGTPQGAVVSPLLANVYLHYVFDLWAHTWRREKASGDMQRAFLQDLQQRLKTFGLNLHTDKTRLIQFGRHAIRDRKQSGLGKPDTFDFLGFTHFCTQSRKNGAFVIGRKTIRKRMRATLGLIKIELRRRMHDRVIDTGRWITKVLQGHVNYFSVSGNSPSIWLFYNEVRTLWIKSLRRRSQKGYINWEKFLCLTNRYFPRIRLVHPHPCHRFDARTRGRSPVR